MRSALPDARAACGPLMCPRIVYVAPSGSPLLQGDFEVLVFLTWKATGSSTVLCAVAGAAFSASRDVQIRPITTAARRQPHRRGRAHQPCACSMITCARTISPTPFTVASTNALDLMVSSLGKGGHNAAIPMLYQIYVYLST